MCHNHTYFVPQSITESVYDSFSYPSVWVSNNLAIMQSVYYISCLSHAIVTQLNHLRENGLHIKSQQNQCSISIPIYPRLADPLSPFCYEIKSRKLAQKLIIKCSIVLWGESAWRTRRTERRYYDVTIPSFCVLVSLTTSCSLFLQWRAFFRVTWTRLTKDMYWAQLLKK